MTTASPAPKSRLGDIALVLGTRPEIIKLSEVIRELGDRARVIHTGQHWDDAMAGQFFHGLGLGEPDVKLDAMRGVPRGLQVARGIEQLTAHFESDRPAAVIVQGDTNSVSAGAQAANYMGIPVIHVEAGLRSHDRNMPEEINRLVVGALADIHCAPTAYSAENLFAEGVNGDSVHITGNTIVEATFRALDSLPATATVTNDDYVLVTIHRPENTDDPVALRRILEALSHVKRQVVFALHPRTKHAIETFGLAHLLSGFDVREGVGHRDFLALAQRARLIVSDSGGVQEEATVLKKPLLVVRRSTERPESMNAGFARLISPSVDLLAAIDDALNDAEGLESLQSAPCPFGDGSASMQIAELARKAASH